MLVYQIDSYRYWERELGRDDFTYGQFGENFTVEGLADDEVWASLSCSTGSPSPCAAASCPARCCR